jgi:adenylosuccinate synthase
MINGFDSLVLTKLDVLDTLEQVQICVDYEVDGRRVDEMPASTRELAQVKPVYESFPGWKTSTKGVSRLEDMAAGAIAYVRRLEELTGIEIGCISTGPERNQTVMMPGSRLESFLRVV